MADFIGPWIDVKMYRDGLQLSWENETHLVELLTAHPSAECVVWRKNPEDPEDLTSLRLHGGGLSSALRAFHREVGELSKGGAK